MVRTKFRGVPVNLSYDEARMTDYPPRENTMRDDVCVENTRDREASIAS